jgi:thiamine-phosphate pyrophosphorylase
LNDYNIIYIQYRDKVNNISIQSKNLKYLQTNTNIPIIINDSIELLEIADGLHIGQEDIKILLKKYNIKSKSTLIKLLRKIHPNKIIGISTHNEIEILEANTLDLDYIGLGAYRNTTTKDISNLLGHNISYLAQMSSHPVCAIGGVNINDKIANISYNVIGSGLL